MYALHLIYEKLIMSVNVQGKYPEYYIHFKETHFNKDIFEIDLTFITYHKPKYEYKITKIPYSFKDRLSVIREINSELNRLYSLVPTKNNNKYICICTDCNAVFNGFTYKKFNKIKCPHCSKDEIKKDLQLNHKKSYVYLMKSELTGLLKIGFSNDPFKRCRNLETSQGGKIELISFINGSRKIETLLHRKFNDFRTEGEWFKYDSQIVDYFFELKKIDIEKREV